MENTDGNLPGPAAGMVADDAGAAAGGTERVGWLDRAADQLTEAIRVLAYSNREEALRAIEHLNQARSCIRGAQGQEVREG